MTGFDDDWRTWHDAREARLRDPHGWLAVTALHWLTDTPDRFTDVPGAWSAGARGVVVVLGADERLTLEGDELGQGRHGLGPVSAEGLRVSYDDAVAEVAARDGGIVLRPRRPDSPARLAYRGTPSYPPDRRWVLDAQFAADPSVEPTGDDEEVAVGAVVFEYGGSEHRLVAWGEDDGSLWILFRDATSGVTTYPANRQLLLDPPDPDGRVEIDFNRATNMPCAYTDFATCPLPPAANTLPFAVEAGEQLPSFAT